MGTQCHFPNRCFVIKLCSYCFFFSYQAKLLGVTSGKTYAVCDSDLRSFPISIKYSIMALRVFLKFGLSFKAVLSLGRSISILNSGPNVALGPGRNGMILSAI